MKQTHILKGTKALEMLNCLYCNIHIQIQFGVQVISIFYEITYWKSIPPRFNSTKFELILKFTVLITVTDSLKTISELLSSTQKKEGPSSYFGMSYGCFNLMCCCSEP